MSHSCSAYVALFVIFQRLDFKHIATLGSNDVAFMADDAIWMAQEGLSSFPNIVLSSTNMVVGKSTPQSEMVSQARSYHCSSIVYPAASPLYTNCILTSSSCCS